MYRAAIAAADPVVVTRQLLAELPKPRRDAALWVFAIGKASRGMATALLAWLGAKAHPRVRGIIVDVAEGPRVHEQLEQRVGNHPGPGRASFAAASRLEEYTTLVRPADQVYVLISGGASSLIGAPMSAISEAEYRATFETLLASGLDIREMNAIRKHISRWGAGRLAEAVSPARVQPVIISDVESDDPATIGSGPCSPDVEGPASAVKILRERRLIEKIPASVRNFLFESSGHHQSIETNLSHVAPVSLAGHDLPVDAAISFAKKRRLKVTKGARLVGDAATSGSDLAITLAAASKKARTPAVVVCGGETTVTLTDDSGVGGRCQELALSAARGLCAAKASRVLLLVAGTDGRDGPTDAAGAIVDSSTWEAISNAGRDPEEDLARHDSYSALDAAGALIRTGHTGTNMMDLAIAIVR